MVALRVSIAMLGINCLSGINTKTIGLKDLRRLLMLFLQSNLRENLTTVLIVLATLSLSNNYGANILKEESKETM